MWETEDEKECSETMSSRHDKAVVHMNPQHLQLLIEALHKTKTVKNSSMPSQPHTAVGLRPMKKTYYYYFSKPIYFKTIF